MAGIDLVAHKMYLDLLIQNLDHVDHLDHLGHAQLPPRFDTDPFPWYTLDSGAYAMTVSVSALRRRSVASQ
jgi:hypothetical protein